MRFGNTGFAVTKDSGGTYWYKTRKSPDWKLSKGSEEEKVLKQMVQLWREKDTMSSDKLEDMLSYYEDVLVSSYEADCKVSFGADHPVDKKAIVAGKIMNFFSEFHFEPNYRFVNTFALSCKESSQSAVDYVTSYFELSDSEFTNSVSEKMKSGEFSELIKETLKLEIKSKINKRFKLYYGSQGTGKTTEALKETDNLCMICHSAMLPSDLMEDFKFDDGKAGFNPSVLWNAIVEGKKICLDEINLLPFESLRFLQSILDGKSEFTYKGEVVKIKEGFQIIGTMNLVVNGSVFSLPEPLIDRAEQLKKFKLTAESLASALA